MTLSRTALLASATLVLAVSGRAAADEGGNGLSAPARAPEVAAVDVNLGLLPQAVIDRPLVLPPLTFRGDLSFLGAGGGGYSPTLGFLPVTTLGVVPGLELTLSVPLLAGQRIEPHFGAQFRFFGSKPVELALRALVSYPTGTDDAAADVALVVAWRTGRWVRIDTELRGAFSFASTVRTGFVWPTIFTVQVSSGFFLGGTTEVDVFPDLGHVVLSVGGFLGGTLAHDGRALCDLRVGGVARDVAGTSVGEAVVVSASFYADPR